MRRFILLVFLACSLLFGTAAHAADLKKVLRELRDLAKNNVALSKLIQDNIHNPNGRLNILIILDAYQKKSSDLAELVTSELARLEAMEKVPGTLERPSLLETVARVEKKMGPKELVLEGPDQRLIDTLAAKYTEAMKQRINAEPNIDLHAEMVKIAREVGWGKELIGRYLHSRPIIGYFRMMNIHDIAAGSFIKMVAPHLKRQMLRGR